MSTAIHLTSTEISKLARPEEYVEVVRNGFREVGEGAPANPRERIYSSSPKGMLTSYMAILQDTGAMGGYMYSAGFSEQTAWFLTPLFDANTGEPLAVLDGASMNPFKTGAAGAVAVDELAREDAGVLAVIGSGRQARGQVWCTSTVRDIREIRVYSPTKASRESFAEDMGKSLSADVRAVSSPSTAIAGTDIIITSTTSSEPVFSGEDLTGGEHITAMGQYHPEKREVDTETVVRSKYVPDLRSRVLKDAGGFLIPMREGAIGEDHIHGELGEVVAGVVPGRETEEEITLFDSGGTGIETTAAAFMLYRKAREQNLGTEIEFEAARDVMTGDPEVEQTEEE